MEHDELNIEFETQGNGLLPAYCHCNGKLDFIKIGSVTILKCRECGNEIELD